MEILPLAGKINTLKPHAVWSASQRALKCRPVCVKYVGGLYLCVCVWCVQCYPAVRGRWGQLVGWSCSPQSGRAQEETGEGPALESTGQRERDNMTAPFWLYFSQRDTQNKTLRRLKTIFYKPCFVWIISQRIKKVWKSLMDRLMPLSCLSKHGATFSIRLT